MHLCDGQTGERTKKTERGRGDGSVCVGMDVGGFKRKAGEK